MFFVFQQNLSITFFGHFPSGFGGSTPHDRFRCEAPQIG